MRVIITEKQSVAAGIADVIGGMRQCAGYLEGEGLRIAPCAGHLLELAAPEDYVGGRFIERKDLPIVPVDWQLRPKDGRAQQQLQVIKALLRDATEVVHAGDADREGQLIVDEVLADLDWRGPTQRLWLSSLDEESVRRALASLQPNASMTGLRDAAIGRQRADWSMGLNGSIAFSRNLHAIGVTGKWSLGRVQTPALTLLVDRQAQIRGHAARDHYKVRAEFAGAIFAMWQIPEDLLDDGLLMDKDAAQRAVDAASGRSATVVRLTRKPGSQSAPLPYSLAALQMAANERFGLTASQTLDAAQALYDAKITTYPRTDCRYLPEEMLADAPTVLSGLDADGLPGIDATRRHAAWDSTEVTGHFGIIPTGKAFDAARLPPTPGNTVLPDHAEKVFGMIRESYLRLFMTAERFEEQAATFRFESDAFASGVTFRATARVVTDPGWTSLGALERDTEDGDAATEGEVSSALSSLTDGQSIECTKALLIPRRTSPPKSYNDKTFLGAMTSVHKLVTDAKLKARLKETSGLGTEATRAGIIEKLIECGYAKRRGKELLPTERGEQLIAMLRRVSPELTDPVETALQEDALADIAAGRRTLESFMTDVVARTRHTVQILLEGHLADPAGPTHTCPACGRARCISLTSKAGKPYHRCADCSESFADENGKPGKQFGERAPLPGDTAMSTCPACGGVRCAALKSQAGKPYHKCQDCQAAFGDDAGKPGKQFEARPVGAVGSATGSGSSGSLCPDCRKPVSSATTGSGKPYFRCRACGGAWWPDRADASKLGGKWPPR